MWDPSSTQWEEDKDREIPEGVREDHRNQALLTLIEPPPEKATNSGSDKKHQVECNHVDKGINGGREQNTCHGTESFIEGSLNKAMPINLFSRTYHKYEKKTNGNGIELCFVQINTGDFSGSKWEHKGGKLFPKPEDSIKQQS